MEQRLIDTRAHRPHANETTLGLNFPTVDLYIKLLTNFSSLNSLEKKVLTCSIDEHKISGA